MAKKLEPLTQWRSTRRKNLPGFVGDFFRHLTSKVMKASFETVGDEDLVMKCIATGIEVKGSDNCHKHRLRHNQLVSHAELVGFPRPLDHFVYCLCCYNNRTAGPRHRSILSGCKGEVEIYYALAKSTSEVYLIDHCALENIAAWKGLSRGSFPCAPGERSIDLGRRDLIRFRDPAILSELKLDPRIWKVRTRTVHVEVDIGIFHHKMVLDVAELIPLQLMDKLNRTLRVPARSNVPSTRRMLIPVNGKNPARVSVAV